MSEQTIYDSVLQKNGSYRRKNSTNSEAVKNAKTSFFNPTSISDSQTEQEQQAYSPSINWAKVYQIGIQERKNGKNGGLDGVINWNAWRDKAYNGLVNVNSNVQLITTAAPKITFEMDQRLDSNFSLEGLASKNNATKGIFSTIQEAHSTINAAAYTWSGFIGNKQEGLWKASQRYEGLHGWEGPGDFKMSADESFIFRFGQAGLYSGMEEVVKPIFALASLIAPHKVKNYMVSALAAPSEYIVGAMFAALKNEFSIKGAVTTAIDSVVTQSKDFVSDLASGGASISSVAQNVTGIGLGAAVALNTFLAQAQDTSVKAALETSNLIYFKLGPMQMGPFYIKGVDINFDLKNTDSEGCPVEGSITFKEVFSPYTPTVNNLLKNIDPELLRRM